MPDECFCFGPPLDDCPIHGKREDKQADPVGKKMDTETMRGWWSAVLGDPIVPKPIDLGSIDISDAWDKIRTSQCRSTYGVRRCELKDGHEGLHVSKARREEEDD